MPTIYDILPTLEKKILDLLKDFMCADKGAFYTWEITIFLPACNAFIHYLDGVNISLKSDNYVSATANLRGLIEALAAVVYDGTIKLPKEGYDRFLKTGRLPIWDTGTKKWTDLGPRESVKYAQLMVDPKLNLKKIYDDCCDLLHFSSKHMAFLGGLEPQKNKEGLFVTVKIGKKDNIPVTTQRQMIDVCAALTTALGQCINAGIEEKGRRKTSKETK